MNLFIIMLLVFKVFLWNVRVTNSICINLSKKFCIFYHKNLLFLFYILTFQNTSHQIIYFTLHFIKISNFLDFFNCFSFSQKIKFKINSVNVNLYCYCRNHVYLYNFILLEVSEFWTWLAKCYTVFVI